MKYSNTRTKIKGLTFIALIASMFLALPAYAATTTSQAASDASANTVVGDTTTTVGPQTTTVGGQTTNITGSETDLNDGRGFPISGEVSFAPLIGPPAKPGHSDSFRAAEAIVLYRKWYTEGALESLIKDAKHLNTDFDIADDNVTLAKPAPEDGKTRWIMISVAYFNADVKRHMQLYPMKYEGKGNVAFRGYADGRSTGPDTDSRDCVFGAALAALKAGCNVYQIEAQGFVTDAYAFGAGFGFHSSQAQVMAGDNSQGNVSSAGLGFSWGHGYARDLPWVKGVGLIDDGLTYPKLRKEGANK